MRYLGITSPDIENGSGFRVTLWISGCNLRCPECHNPKSHSFTAGKEVDDNVFEEVCNKLDKPYIKGLTLSGGNPLDSDIEELISFISKIKSRFPSKDIWLFSGYTLDEILGTEKEKVLEYVDVLVDGPFKRNLRKTSIAFRGSTNQIIWEKGEDGKFKISKYN